MMISFIRGKNAPPINTCSVQKTSPFLSYLENQELNKTKPVWLREGGPDSASSAPIYIFSIADGLCEPVKSNASYIHGEVHFRFIEAPRKYMKEGQPA